MTRRLPPSQADRRNLEDALRQTARSHQSLAGPGFLGGRMGLPQPTPAGSDPYAEAADADDAEDDATDEQYEADDRHKITAADVARGYAVVPLSHEPIAESLEAYWVGVWQAPTEYVLDYGRHRILWPLSGFEAAGDVLGVHYAYRAGIVVPGIVVPTAYYDAVMADAPLGYWRLGEPGGATVAVDSSGNGHDGSYSGLTPAQLGVPGLLTGDTDTAMELFQDANDNMNVPAGVWMNTPRLAIECWVRFTGGLHAAIVSRYGDAANRPWHLATDLLQARNADDTVHQLPLPAGTFALNTRYHVVAVIEDPSMTLYVNNVAVATRSFVGPLRASTTQGMFVGMQPGILASVPAAVFDEVALYETLSPERRAVHYNIGSGGPA